MNGNTLRHTVAAFRLIPYIQREDLNQLASDPDAEGEDLDQGPESGELAEAGSELEYADSTHSDTEGSIG